MDEINRFIAAHRGSFRDKPDFTPHMVLNDGARLSIQAGRHSFCEPKSDAMPTNGYDSFEVWMDHGLSDAEKLAIYGEKDEWQDYVGDEPASRVSIATLLQVINAHGGIWGARPVLSAGKWDDSSIPVSAHECTCRACVEASGDMPGTRMIVCADCSNKRCPKATDHRNPCTGSNELGQEGSVYA